MQDIKIVIQKLKEIAKLNSNIELANYLNISYNTLNTWIKREKIPQEVLINFCIKNSCSLDYLLLDKEFKTTLFSTSNTNSKDSFEFYGSIKELDIKGKTILKLEKNIYHNGAYYLIYSNDIYYVKEVYFNILDSKVTIDNTTIDINKFKDINLGLITSFTK
jgi:hypothetical protein